MARSRKSKKSPDKADEVAKNTESVEAVADETVESGADTQVADADTQAVEASSEDTQDQLEATEAEQSSENDGEAATVEAEEAEISETDAASVASEDADVASEDADLGDDTLLTEGETEPSSEADAANLEETPDEAEDATLLEDAAETEENEKQDSATETDHRPETAPAPVQQQSSGFWPAIFGGLVAALLGFIAGRGDTLDGILPASMQRAEVDLTELENQTAALAEADQKLSETLAQMAEGEGALQSRIAALETAEPVAADGSADASGLSESINALEASLAGIAERVTALEERPVAAEQTGEYASTADVSALQETLDAQKAEIEALSERAAQAEAEAASEARRILARAALTRVVTAVDTGESFSPALQDLEDAAAAEVPEQLRTVAETGVPTMAALSESFPDAARAGLAAARAETPESEVQGVSGFLRRTLSARSVVPKEGDDPDAILSRAEAAVKAGDLDTALTEMDALPESAKAAMSDWLDAANARKNVRDAAQELADSLNGN